MKNRKSKILLIITFSIIFTGCKYDIAKKDVINDNVNNKSGIEKNRNEILEVSETKIKKEEELYKISYDLFFQNKYDECIEKANVLISEFPKSYKGYNIRGIAKAYNGDFEDGMQDINKALEFEPNYGYALFNKALAYELYENLDEAINYYNKALAVEKYVWSYYGIASCYGRRGDVSNTIKYLNEAIKLDDSIKNHAREEADFNPVKNDSRFIELIN